MTLLQPQRLGAKKKNNQQRQRSIKKQILPILLFNECTSWGRKSSPTGKLCFLHSLEASEAWLQGHLRRTIWEENWDHLRYPPVWLQGPEEEDGMYMAKMVILLNSNLEWWLAWQQAQLVMPWENDLINSPTPKIVWTRTIYQLKVWTLKFCPGRGQVQCHRSSLLA